MEAVHILVHNTRDTSHSTSYAIGTQGYKPTTTGTYLLRRPLCGVLRDSGGRNSGWHISEDLAQPLHHSICADLLLGEPRIVITSGVLIPVVMRLHQRLDVALHETEGQSLHYQLAFFSSATRFSVPVIAMYWSVHARLRQLRTLVVNVEPFGLVGVNLDSRATDYLGGLWHLVVASAGKPSGIVPNTDESPRTPHKSEHKWRCG